jgi:PleD family two-component response regulator
MKTNSETNLNCSEYMSGAALVGPAFAASECSASIYETNFRAWRPELGSVRMGRMISQLLKTVSKAMVNCPTGELNDATIASQTMEERATAKARACILMVDDDTFNFTLIEDICNCDFEVLFATDGLAALDIAIEKMPDLILLDVMMPGIDGYEVCRRLKAEDRTRHIPIIFITGVGDKTAEARALELGAVDYITKPINVAVVKARVNQHIKMKWTLDRFNQVAVLEKTLREDLLKVLEIKSRYQPVH